MSDKPPRPRRPFDTSRAAMLLLAVLIISGAAVVLLVSVKCTLISPDSKFCTERSWGQTIREWLTDTIPVLIALIMWRPPPQE